MKREDYVTLVDVDGYDCSWEDKVIVTMGFNIWDISLDTLRVQLCTDRPTYILGYNIDPAVLGWNPPYTPEEFTTMEYPDSDKYFELTTATTKEILKAYKENREVEICGQEDINIELIEEFQNQLWNYDIVLKEMLEHLYEGTTTRQDYIDYQEMLLLKNGWDNV